MTIGPEPTMRMEWRSSRRGMKGARGGWNETAAPGLAGIRTFGASPRNARRPRDGDSPPGRAGMSLPPPAGSATREGEGLPYEVEPRLEAFRHLPVADLDHLEAPRPLRPAEDEGPVGA